ncbi:MAG: hypothetical protein GTO03_07295 [Planctomycetales bacterium]|nr:hypothetical protein [Planctomycetales bacterium]
MTSTGSTDATQPPPRTAVGVGSRLKIVLLLVLASGLLVAFKFLPVNQYLAQFLSFLEGLGVWAPILLAAAYIVATVLMVPGTILTLGAGFAFGLVKGVLSVMAGSVIGALCAFLVGRTLGRGFVEQKVRENPRFAAVDAAVERDGFKIVLLTRLSPLFPFNLLNYLFSVTKVRTRDYFFASWIGMFPGTVMYVYLGTAVKNVADLVSGKVERGMGAQIVFAVGLLATVIVTVYVTRIARRAIRECVPEQNSVSSRSAKVENDP